ncbi:Hypothetical predicted protein [Mytilus galloprovincialis]|uniref:Uncharacterized protein n=1 Tax=Mytilus galloprovincialis TaxID=29158 RepID=A0A8B6CSC9_MYTGA|nr:Hypothetical predicted protein [Mytilus galloprovincialis]
MRVLEAPPIILRLQQLITRCRFITGLKRCNTLGTQWTMLHCGESLFYSQYGQLLQIKHYTWTPMDIAIWMDIIQSLSSGKPKYNFGQRSSASSLCSTGRYLTVKLEKENYKSTNFQFKLRILEESQSKNQTSKLFRTASTVSTCTSYQDQDQDTSDGLINGLNGFVMSVGVIIAIIICVVVLITVFAVVIVCCCCKTGGISQSKGIKMNRQSGPQQGCSNQRPAPSAPPLQDYGHDGYHSVPIQDGEPPPAYSEQPPPYTTADIPS